MTFRDELKVVYHGVDNTNEFDGFTVEFIDKIKNTLITFVSDHKMNIEKPLPKQIKMNVNRAANISHVCKWLNKEKIPFEVSTAHVDGRIGDSNVIFDPKLIIQFIK